MVRVLLIMLLMGMVPAAGLAEDQLLKDQKARDSYSMGYEYGDSLKRQPLDLDTEVLFRAIRDAMAGKKPAMSPGEMRETLLDMRKRAMTVQDRRIREQAAANREKECTFLAANGKRSGVITLPDGVQYKVLQEGTGAFPQKNDMVKVGYRGTLIDGTEFDSTYRREEPTIMPVSSGIRGLDEVLPLMREGSKWQLFIPSPLAYGKRSYNLIPPNSTLIFELELLSIEKSGDEKP